MHCGRARLRAWQMLLIAFLAGGLWLRAAAQPTEIQYLSGHGKDDAVPWKFFCTSGAQSGYWTNLPVPSQWDLHGFGTLGYHKDETNAWNERGLYEHDFTVPASWAARRIFLVFDGVMTDTAAKMNGQPVGPVHQGGFYRFKYEVTSLVKCGMTNRLEVNVARHSTNESVNRAERLADYWVFAGIYRPVYLEAVPRQFIERLAVDAEATGSFALNVFLNGITAAGQIEAQIQTLDGQAVGKPFTASFSAGQHLDAVKLKTQIAAPKLWTAETPNLYQVAVRLQENGKVLHEVGQRFGFRTFEVRDGDGLYLNGRRVVLKGCDRHSFWPDSGRCLSDAVQLLDINTMKDMNMNAVRMSHYPPDADFLDRCDELGLYVLDELAGWHHYYDTSIGTNLVREMVARDVNHPCILFWDNGNEGGFNTQLDPVFGQYDPQHRRVLHPWATFDGVNTAHYLPYDFAQLACQGLAIAFHKNHYAAETNSAQKFIYMPTEFMHGLYDGGAGAGLAETWALMSQSPYLGGGFIWALLDEGVKRPDTGTIDVAGNQAPDGIVGPYRQREASFYAVKEIWSPLTILETNLPPDFDGTLTLENHYSFINARQCQFTWQLRRFVGATNGGLETVAAEGRAESPDIAPGGRGQLRLRLPENWRHTAQITESGALALQMKDPGGRELWTYVWPLPELAHSPIFATQAEGLKLSSKSVPVISESATTIHVQAGDLSVSFDRQTGRLNGVKRGRQDYSLVNGPRPAFGPASLTQVTARITNHQAVIHAVYSTGLKDVVWRINADGWVQCDYSYPARGEQDCFGVLFDYPEKLVRRKRWLGDGPYRVWRNRLAGATFGEWQNDYNDTITGYRDWVYPEFKGCFANVRWLQLDTAEGQITVEPVAVPYVQVLTPNFPPANLAGHTLPALPECGLGFLNVIPPIGSKFQGAAQVSPSGKPFIGQGEYAGTVRFYFGAQPDAE